MSALVAWSRAGPDEGYSVPGGRARTRLSGRYPVAELLVIPGRAGVVRARPREPDRRHRGVAWVRDSEATLVTRVGDTGPWVASAAEIGRRIILGPAWDGFDRVRPQGARPVERVARPRRGMCSRDAWRGSGV